MTFVAGTVLTAAALNSELASKTDLAMTQNAQTGTSYSYALADASKLLTMSNAASNTVTVTKQATVTWVTGTQLRIINLGAGVTTLVADTGVTINGNVALKQYQGGQLIRTASDVWLFVPTASSGGMDLITPTSVAGSGVTLSGGQVNFATASSVSVNGCFTSAYENYVVAIYGFGDTAGRDMTTRLRASGTDNALNYSYTSMSTPASPVTAANATAQTSIASGNFSGTGSVLFATIYRPQLTALTFYELRCNRGDNNYQTFSGYQNSSTAYDGLTIIPSTSTISGNMRIYGLRNS